MPSHPRTTLIAGYPEADASPCGPRLNGLSEGGFVILFVILKASSAPYRYGVLYYAQGIRVLTTQFPRIQAHPSRTTHLTWTNRYALRLGAELGMDTSPQHATTIEASGVGVSDPLVKHSCNLRPEI